LSDRDFTGVISHNAIFEGGGAIMPAKIENQTTRASCASCHPRLSNCGLEVEKMDTTFQSSTSKHNIHFVKCADCHTKGVPKRSERLHTD